MSWNYRPLSCGRDTLITSSSSCALRDSLRLQSTLSATMYSNWLARSPIFLPQNSIPDPWWSGAVHERGLMKRGMPTTARSGGSSGGLTRLPIAATYRRCCRASVAPQEFRAPSLSPSWWTASITRVHVMPSSCGWQLRPACGAWRSLTSRLAMSTRAPTGGTFSCEERAVARGLCRSRPTWQGQSSRAAQQLDSTRFLDVAADTWPPIQSRKSDAGSCLAPGRYTSYAIGTQRRRTRPSMTCSLCANSWAMHRSRRPSATSRHPPELATQFSQQPASSRPPPAAALRLSDPTRRQHCRTSRQRWRARQCWHCQPPAISTERAQTHERR